MYLDYRRNLPPFCLPLKCAIQLSVTSLFQPNTSPNVLQNVSLRVYGMLEEEALTR